MLPPAARFHQVAQDAWDSARVGAIAAAQLLGIGIRWTLARANSAIAGWTRAATAPATRPRAIPLPPLAEDSALAAPTPGRSTTGQVIPFPVPPAARQPGAVPPVEELVARYTRAALPGTGECVPTPRRAPARRAHPAQLALDLQEIAATAMESAR